MDSISSNFLGLSDEETAYDRARVAVVPVPFEATVSYGRGTAKGPAAIIAASSEVELYDEELGCEPCDVGIATLLPLDMGCVAPSRLHERIAPAIGKVVDDGKLPLVLGGEHSITPHIVKAVCGRLPGLTVVQLDAHADLRQEYLGERASHACAMARVREMCPAVQIGIRSLSREEGDWAEREGLQLFYAHQMRSDVDWMAKAIAAIRTEIVYVTIDIDVFDSGIMPATGTPEPGGLGWHQVTEFLQMLAQQKNIVGFDIVELAPIEGFAACDFLAAKLAYKCVGYWRGSLR